MEEKANRISGKMAVKGDKMEIKDYDTYISGMRKTYYDKCWWINHIPDNIKYIIDFGCADAGIFEFIDSMYPGRFIYIGVEENEEMLKIAKEKYGGNERVCLCKSLNEVRGTFPPYDAILLLNSVLHEILTYKTYVEYMNFLFEVRKLAPAFIAIRDMNNLDPKPVADIRSKIHNNDRFKEHLLYSGFGEYDINLYIEFLLKYFYDKNWDREVRETYLWKLDFYFERFLCEYMRIFDNVAGQFIIYHGCYSVEYEEDFSIKYLRDKWEKDFGVKIDIPTHKKMLFKRN